VIVAPPCCQSSRLPGANSQ